MIAFIFAHPDDESFGPLGTIAKLAKDNEVFVLSICNGSRPGTQVEIIRKNTFNDVCNYLGAQSATLEYDDCRLDLITISEVINAFIHNNKPSVVYTHSLTDVHRDHRIVAEACLVASRPKPESSVNSLYFCEIPAATEWAFNQHGAFTPNVYVDISEFINTKKHLLNLYSTETYDYPDARSIQHMVDLAKIRGSQSGFEYAEAFQLVFSRNHKSL